MDQDLLGSLREEAPGGGALLRNEHSRYVHIAVNYMSQKASQIAARLGLRDGLHATALSLEKEVWLHTQEVVCDQIKRRLPQNVGRACAHLCP